MRKTLGELLKDSGKTPKITQELDLINYFFLSDDFPYDCTKFKSCIVLTVSILIANQERK